MHTKHPKELLDDDKPSKLEIGDNKGSKEPIKLKKHNTNVDKGSPKLKKQVSFYEDKVGKNKDEAEEDEKLPLIENIEIEPK